MLNYKDDLIRQINIIKTNRFKTNTDEKDLCKGRRDSVQGGEHVEGSSSQLTDDNDVVWDNNDNDSNN